MTIPVEGYLKTKGFTDEEIGGMDAGTLANFRKILNTEPLDQEAVKTYLMAKIFLTSQELVAPKNLWQSILGLFGYDPTESMKKATLNICTELYKIMEYDPKEAMRKLDADLTRRAQG